MILGIYGAGGLGREILLIAQKINNIEMRWDKIIFIDDAKDKDTLNGIEISTFNNVLVQYDIKSIEIVIAVGEPSIRHLLRDKITKEGYHLTVLVHPSVSIPDDSKLGAGTIINFNCFISSNVITGENVLIQPVASIGHDNIIGNDTVIAAHVCSAGGCRIGSETYIGLHVPIKENIMIGDQSIVGMGSVVTRNIPDKVIAIGNPARPMKNNIENKVFHKITDEV